ncbi:phosphatase 2C-like domain-containing protein [Mycena vitilis]|nr:phosphatase 2C-like domain-containing protein [Mycena vitilis]
MDSIVGSMETISEDSLPVVQIHRAELQSKNEDRTTVLHFDHGIIIAIFDGHCGSDLAIFAAETLPALLAVFELFEEDEDWSDEAWLDEAEQVFPVIGYNYGDESFRLGRRAALGCTALIAFLDKSRENQVASLGDSDAVCARREEGNFTPIFLSERHNCSNPAELERMRAEHPNEDHAVVHGAAVLGCLRVTRSLGDHQLKVPLLMASRVMPYFYPSLMTPANFETLSSYTPPYISSTAAVRRHCVAPGDLFLLASDGLRDILPFSDAENFPSSLPSPMERLTLGSGTSALRLTTGITLPRAS